MINIADIINPNIPVPGKPTTWGYRIMTDEEYHSFPAISRSAILGARTLHEAYMALTKPQQQSDALNLGTAFDLAMLTPEVPWTHRFVGVEIPINPKTGECYGKDTKKAEAAMAAAAAHYPDKHIVSLSDLEDLRDEVLRMRAAFLRHPACAAALKGSLKQVSGIMWHPVWKCWVKWKPDILPLEPLAEYGWVIGDLKSSRRHPEEFNKDAWDFGYYDQAGWYSHCHETLLRTQGLELKIEHFFFFCLHKAENGKMPREEMACWHAVPMDRMNLRLSGFIDKVFPTDGMGIIQRFLGAVQEHRDRNPQTPDEIRKVWPGYEFQDRPRMLVTLARE